MLSSFDRNLEKLDRFETDYLRILYYDFGESYTGNYKSYEYHRFCTIMNGEKKVKINNNKEVTYKKDKFIILPPESNVDMIIEKPTKALVFEMNNDLIKNVSDKINYEFNHEVIRNEKDFFLGKNNDSLCQSIGKILTMSNSTGDNKEFLIDLYAQEMTYNLLKVKGVESVLKGDKENTPIGKIFKYISNNLNRPIAIRELSRLVNMSESNFSIFFKKQTGICAKDCIKEMKLKKAAELLKKQNVTETAFDLGYENISYFIRLFKGRYGVTPKQFIKKIEQGEEIYI